VSGFTQRAEQLLEAAEAAVARGESCSHVTMLIAHDGGIRMLAESDWPLDSLARQHGARAVYRVSENKGAVRVEAREGSRTCVMESLPGAALARMLLATTPQPTPRAQ
jgi:hypothetical protein